MPQHSSIIPMAVGQHSPVSAEQPGCALQAASAGGGLPPPPPPPPPLGGGGLPPPPLLPLPPPEGRQLSSASDLSFEGTGLRGGANGFAASSAT